MAGGDHVNAGSSAVKLTYDDFLLFPDDGKRHELIDGEHYVTPSPNRRHQEISGNLFGPMWAYLSHTEGVGLERSGVAEYWVVDPELDAIKVYRRSSDGHNVRAAALTLEAHDILTTPLLPGLELPLAEIFED